MKISLIAILMCGSGVASARDNYLSPLALVADKQGDHLYIAEYTAERIAVYDLNHNKVSKTLALPDQPSGLTLSPDGSTLYVTCAAPEGAVCRIDLQTGRTDPIPCGHTPVSPVISLDGRRLYVCNRFNNNVSVIDPAAGKEIARIPVVREPIAAILTSDGKHLFVANHLPAGPADGDYIAAQVSVIDTADMKVATNIALPNGSTGLQGICISPDGKCVYVTHILARYHMPTTQLERGWMNTNALSIIDTDGQKLLNTILLDDINLGAANPWGVTCTADDRYICVTHAGTHELSVIDRSKLFDKLKKVDNPEDVPNDLTFLAGGLRQRIKLGGNGPRGLTAVGHTVYITEYFSDKLGVVEIKDKIRNAKSLALGSPYPLSTVRKGEMLFHNARHCFQQWQSCASCHPDARADALNWDLMNDGLGNPRNTKSLLLAHKTPPAMITGIRADAETAVRTGIKHIQFVVRPEEEAAVIDEYLKSLQPVPSPYLVEGKLSESAERGRQIFERAGCSTCHSAPLFTNLQQYNVGTGKGRKSNSSFDTPTLIEVWRTAPYLFDGRSATMEDVIRKHNNNDAHGKTSQLTDKEIKELSEYVLSQ